MTHVPAPGDAGVLRLGDALRHRSGGPDPIAFVVSLLLHAAAVAVFFFAGKSLTPDVVEYKTVAIHLVSPPPTVRGPPEPTQTTEAVVTTPTVETPKVAEPAPAKPTPKTQSAIDTKVTSKPTAKPAQGLNPKPGPVGGEGLNINQDGIPFPYPDYLKNVIFRLESSLRWQGAANLTTEVGFYIRRDGSIAALKTLKSSGNMQFDVAAMEAVENASRSKAFGPLPKEWQGDRLAISFTFVPTR